MEPFARGRDADVFALSDGRVLRRYRDGGSVAAEATVMAYVADHGYPVPTVFEAAGPDLVMERLDGRPSWPRRRLAKTRPSRHSPLHCFRSSSRPWRRTR